MPLYTDIDNLPEQVPADDYLRMTWMEVANQIYRLKRQWGYGRWTAGEAKALADEQANISVMIQLANPEVVGGGIPKIFHRVWRGDPMPEEFEANWRDFKALHPEWEFRTWTPENVSELHEALPLTKAKNHAQWSDMVRLLALKDHGGVYVDTDVFPVKAFDPLTAHSCFLGWEDEKVAPNTIIGATRKHPAISAMISLQAMRIPGPTWWAGPGVTTAIGIGRRDVAIFDNDIFYPVHYNDPDKDGHLNLFRADDWPDTFAVHEYANSWNKKGQ